MRNISGNNEELTVEEKKMVRKRFKERLKKRKREAPSLAATLSEKDK